MVDQHGQTWTNLSAHAFRFFRITNLTQEFAVLTDEFPAAWIADSAISLPPFERISAKAYEFRIPHSAMFRKALRALAETYSRLHPDL